MVVRTGLAVARAWILLSTPPAAPKESISGRTPGSKALPSRIVISQLERPTNSGSPLALEVNP